MTQLALLDEVARGGDNELWPTSPETADLMVRWSGVTADDVILEPSAGEGALCHGARRAHRGIRVLAVEIDVRHRVRLDECADQVLIGDWPKIDAMWSIIQRDAGDVGLAAHVTRTLTNPPFSLIRSHLLPATRRASNGSIALLPLYALENDNRHTDLWSKVNVPRVGVFRNRPTFGGGHKPSIAYCLAEIRALAPGQLPDRSTNLHWL